MCQYPSPIGFKILVRTDIVRQVSIDEDLLGLREPVSLGECIRAEGCVKPPTILCERHSLAQSYEPLISEPFVGRMIDELVRDKRPRTFTGISNESEAEVSPRFRIGRECLLSRHMPDWNGLWVQRQKGPHHAARSHLRVAYPHESVAMRYDLFGSEVRLLSCTLPDRQRLLLIVATEGADQPTSYLAMFSSRGIREPSCESSQFNLVRQLLCRCPGRLADGPT